jgi:hypothetical protein
LLTKAIAAMETLSFRELEQYRHSELPASEPECFQRIIDQDGLRPRAETGGVALFELAPLSFNELERYRLFETPASEIVSFDRAAYLDEHRPRTETDDMPLDNPFKNVEDGDVPSYASDIVENAKSAQIMVDEQERQRLAEVVISVAGRISEPAETTRVLVQDQGLQRLAREVIPVC